ncbi:MAG TPA: NUDIX domain-containing protein [Candidatus Sulfomarinibacteraceae bacterium]|nr:NUDIX domain-containing protein [Candidatus Sulfomarinibacteraceae bacterium]
MTTPVQKVVAYITWQKRLLVFRQPAFPDAGIQVPAGTMEEGERPELAVLREAWEETGLGGLSVVTFLGQRDRVFRSADTGQVAVARRHYFHLRFDGQAPERWQHWETSPSEGPHPRILFELWWVRHPHETPALVADLDAFLADIVL